MTLLEIKKNDTTIFMIALNDKFNMTVTNDKIIFNNQEYLIDKNTEFDITIKKEIA